MKLHEEAQFAVLELERHNIKYDARNTDGGHVEIAWQVSPDKEVRRVFTSKTPSDHRTRLNARSYIRRALRQDGVNIDPKPETTKKPALLEKALQAPRREPTIPEQLAAIRSEMADMIDLMLDVSNALSAMKDQNHPPVEAAPITAPIVETKPVKKPSVRSKKAIDFVSTSWNSLEAIARDMGLPPEITYRKLYYLKKQEQVEFNGGRCRLMPGKPHLVRAQA
jgi:hypothetical protein